MWFLWQVEKDWIFSLFDYTITIIFFIDNVWAVKSEDWKVNNLRDWMIIMDLEMVCWRRSLKILIRKLVFFVSFPPRMDGCWETEWDVEDCGTLDDPVPFVVLVCGDEECSCALWYGELDTSSSWGHWDELRGCCMLVYRIVQAWFLSL